MDYWTELLKLPKQLRQSHCDLNSECILNTCQWGYRQALAKYQGLDKMPPPTVQACHVCNNGSTKKHTCINPLHIYWGSASDNMLDRGQEDLRRVALIAVNAQRENRQNRFDTKCQSERGKKAGLLQRKRNGWTVESITFVYDLFTTLKFGAAGRVVNGEIERIYQAQLTEGHSLSKKAIARLLRHYERGTTIEEFGEL